MMRREMRARRRLGANSRSTDVVVTPHGLTSTCLQTYLPTLHVIWRGATAPTYLPPALSCGGPTYYEKT